MSRPNRQQILGWIAVGLSTIIACVWALWGIIENFHEGWYYDSLASNLALMFGQYLSVMLIFLVVTLVAIRWPRVGGFLHALIGFLLVFYFYPLYRTALTLITGPLILLGTLYWFGRPQPRKRACLLIVGLPMLTLIVCGVEPVYRVAGRVDDGNLQARAVEGNGVKLIWAPDGPGWPRDGVSWQEAIRRCQYLREDGQTLADTPQNIWRLPTAEEAVRSMARHGQNCGGVWNSELAQASYRLTPDKESPLWNVHSKVIYWWTGTEVDERRAYIIVYDGKVWPREKRMRPGYLGFRAVKMLPPSRSSE